MTIFTKIINREIPADIVYEDDQCIAFRDVSPQAPVHILVIPKKPIVNVENISDEDAPLIGHIWSKIRDIARAEGLAEDGYRVVVNCGANGGQSVDHLHYHLLGGRSLTWPPG